MWSRCRAGPQLVGLREGVASLRARHRCRAALQTRRLHVLVLQTVQCAKALAVHSASPLQAWPCSPSRDEGSSACRQALCQIRRAEKRGGGVTEVPHAWGRARRRAVRSKHRNLLDQAVPEAGAEGGRAAGASQAGGGWKPQGT